MSSDLAASAAFFMSAVKVVHSCLLSAIFLIVSRSFCDVREMLRFCSILRSLLRVIGCGDRPTSGSLGIVMEIECHSFVGRDRWFSPKYMTEQPPPCLQHFQRNWGLFTFFVEGLIWNFCWVSNSQNPAQLLSMERVQLFFVCFGQCPCAAIV